ncbi:uncharacterized protein LOC108109708 [Drosophila eugracilis]|uniref:uncharacterized protein LOC108109708 n=1 Tax=Drosophila eugracilis TaxID=29029 RepID=UPI0007E7FC54|nr:uncharacterized protein LOC108109708 [Drosophila eugracilis]
MNNKCENNDSGSLVPEDASELVESSSHGRISPGGSGGQTEDPKLHDPETNDTKLDVPKSEASNGSDSAREDASNVGDSKDVVPKSDASNGDVPKTGDPKTCGSKGGDPEVEKPTAQPRSGEGVLRSTQNQTGNYDPYREPPPAKRARRDLPPRAIEQILKNLANDTPAQGETDVIRGAEVDNKENAPPTEVEQRNEGEVGEDQKKSD